MPGAELTPVQRFVLVTLMIKGGTLSNPELTNVAGISLKAQYRNDLQARGLITVTGRPLVLELSEKGWSEAIRELGAEVPPRSGSGGGALYVALGFLRALIGHLGVAPSELFTLRIGPLDGKAVSAPADLGETIRKAYGRVAARGGDYVRLADLRHAVRADVDTALLAMNWEPDVDLIPNSQQGDLTDEDRAAAVRIGNQDRHLIAIGS
jgi:hypothetical protein